MPSDRIAYLTLDEALEIQQGVIDRFGGEPGLRDPGLLESALYRPQTGYYADVFEIAAALFESLIINHPFIDGNKRAAFFCSDVFLRLNGYRLVVDADDAHALLMKWLTENTCDMEHILPWIRASAARL